MDTSEINAKLRKRYDGTEWAIAFEVPTSTGGGRRRCDLLAMSLWRSKGLYLHGHEVKVSRSDWLKEIDDPSKADAFVTKCHYWWIVAPKGVVKLEELPANWGLLHCSEKSSLRVGKAATKLEPEPISWPFFAACMRAFEQQSDAEKTLRQEYTRGWNEGRKYEEDNQGRMKGYREKRTDQDLQRLRKSVEEFQQASGIEIESYNGKSLGESVAALQKALGYKSLPQLVSEGKSAFDALCELFPVEKGS